MALNLFLSLMEVFFQRKLNKRMSVEGMLDIFSKMLNLIWILTKNFELVLLNYSTKQPPIIGLR